MFLISDKNFNLSTIPFFSKRKKKRAKQLAEIRIYRILSYIFFV